MILKKLTPLASLNKAYQKLKPQRNEFERFKTELQNFFNEINLDESEEHNKKYITDLLEKTFYSNYKINTKYRTDLAVYLGKSAKDKVGVILEVKHPNNKGEMIKPDNLNAKAMQEAMRYYFSERIDEKNDEIKSIVITNLYEWFIFDAQLFERIFYKNSGLKKNYESWKSNSKVSSNTEHFYNEIAKPFLENLEDEIPFTYFNLKEYKFSDEKKLIPLFKIFSPEHLLKVPFANDSNTLNKPFYQELLYLIGLEEVKEGSKKIIRRKDEKTRNSGSLLENTITILKSKDSVIYFNDKEKYGSTKEEQLFNIALELNITWINRILFLKLLEAQIISYHKGDKSRKFLDSSIILDFDILHELFHEVLAVKIEDRNKDILEHFKNVPYLNSSLFDISRLERKTINISELKNRYKIPYYNQTVIKENGKRKTDEVSILKYLLDFLDAYDFASESTGDDIQEENKSLINASVLGRIFEKINGYKEGSIFTPGFITMYMSRETIRRAVVQKFNDHLNTTYKDFNELSKEIDKSTKGREEANNIINSIKICDPAVGSGHFLVSALNEIIAVKSELGVLNYRDGSRFQEYKVEIENDELIVTNKETEEIFEYHLNDKGNPVEDLQKVQEALFHEKETIIENCLFGVDINPNSVNICRLRLWIELLKNSYYTPLSSTRRGAGGEVGLQTLPNIDINIKQGNSLISRFKLDVDLKKALKTIRYSIDDYKNFVSGYRNAKSKEEKINFSNFIEDIKKNFRSEISANDPRRKKLNLLSYELHTKFEADRLVDVELSETGKKKAEKEKAKLVKQIDKISEELKAEENGEIYRNAFEWRFEFPEVLDDDGNFVGFDVVIGNPPYIRQEKIDREFKKFYMTAYDNVGNGIADIYVYFFGRSLQIVKPNYLLSFITLNKWLKTKYGTKLRQVLEKLDVYKIIDFFELPIFDEAATDSAITLVKNQKNISASIYIPIRNISDLKKDIDQLDNQEIHKAKTEWLFFGSSLTGIIEKFETDTLPLIEFTNDQIFYGVKTGLNKVFIIDNEEKEKICAKDVKSNGIIHKYIRPTEIKKYNVNWKGDWIIFTRRGIDINLYPGVKNYLEKFRDILEPKPANWKGEWKGRKPGSYEWYEIQDSVAYYEIFDKNKLIYIHTAKNHEFYFDSEGYYVNNSCYLIASDRRYLWAFLNSKIFNWYKKIKFVAYGDAENAGRVKLDYNKMKDVPIKVPSKKQESQITELVDQILTKKKSNPEADITVEEKEIDKLVYELYGLTEEEIKIVEGNGE